MNILNLTSFHSLDNKISKAFSKKLENEVNSFHKIFDSIECQSFLELDLIVSNPISRNTISSPLYFNYCMILLLKDLVESKKITMFDKVILSSKTMSGYLENLLIEKNINSIKIVKSRRFDVKIKPFLVYLQTIFAFVGRFVIIRLFKSSKKINSKDLISLIETPILKGFIDKDRYYGSLWDKLDYKDSQKIYFVPTFSNKKIFSNWKIVNEIKKSQKNYLFKESFVSFKDLFFALNHFFRVKKIKLAPILINEFDFTKFIYDEFNENYNLQSSVEGIINFKFAENLKKYDIKIKSLISWYENQSFDKGWFYGFNVFFPKLNTKGYRGVIPSNLLLCQMYPIPFEKRMNILPKNILLTGEGFIDSVKTYEKNIDISLAPAFRYEHVWQRIQTENKKQKRAILIALPITFNDSIYLINQVIECVDYLKNNSIKVIIKSHPATNIKSFKKAFGKKWPDNFVIMDEDSKSLLRRVNILISGMSSICLESMAIGVPVVIINRQGGINYNSIPMEIKQTLWKLSSDSSEMLLNIKHFLKKDRNELLELKLESKELRKKYFQPLDNHKIKSLFKH